MKSRLLTLLLLTWAAASFARPAQVILLRHAEKPANESDQHLSERGKLRAEALADCLTTNLTLLSSNGLPASLFAPKITGRGNVRRPFETLERLAKRLGKPVEMPYSRAHYGLLAKRILLDASLQGKTVVICWVHDDLPALAAAFGVKSKRLTWKGDVYDRFWVIQWDRNHARLAEVPQHLLPDDSP